MARPLGPFAPHRAQWLNASMMQMLLNAVHDRHGGRVFLVEVGSGTGEGQPELAPRFDEGWSGLLIEPHPRNFAALEARHANSERVAVLNLAISDLSGNQSLYSLAPEALAARPRRRPGQASLLRDRIATPDLTESEIDAVEVPVLRLDTVLRELGLDSVQIVLINAGGAEEQVLRSFDPAAVGASLVLIRSVADTAEDGAIVRLLYTAGLSVFRVGPWLAGLRGLSIPLEDLFTHFNRAVDPVRVEDPSLQPSGILHHADP